MEVEYAFLADAAQTGPDGKLHVIGGGIDRIFSGQFPARHGLLSLVVKLRLHPTECERPHKLEIQLWDKDGHRLGPQIDGEFTAQKQPKMRPGSLQTVLNLFGMEFPKADEYDFHIIIDGQHRKTLPLYVERIEAGTAPGQPPPIPPPDASES